MKYLILTIFTLLINNLMWAEDSNFDLENYDFKKNVRNLSNQRYSKDDVDFSAENIDYNVKNNTLKATGNVTFKSEGKTLISDTLFYNSENDVLYAKGNVVFIDENGNKIYSEEAIFDPKINTGLISKFKTIFYDNSTMTAKSADKKNETTFSLSNMEFTACSIINNNIPTWELKSKRAYYNEEKGEVNLYSAWLEVKGIPIMWTPYFSFSNLNFIRKIGFLTPSYELNSIYGYAGIIPFYIPIGNHQDITIKLYGFLESNPLYYVDYNGYLENGYFSSSFSFVEPQNDKALYDETSKWHYFLTSKKELSDIWRGSIRVEQVSDQQYLNVYNINPKDRSESFFINRGSLEGFFSNNFYFSSSVSTYEIINPNFLNNLNSSQIKNLDKSVTLNYYYYGDYSNLGKINLYIDTEALLYNDVDNLSRMVAGTDYTYKIPSKTGLYSVEAIIQGIYYSDSQSEIKRVLDPSVVAFGGSLSWEHPFIYLSDNFVYTFVPIAQLSYSKYSNTNNNDFLIDSYNINLTANNLFEINHFQGYDQFEESQDLKYALQFSLLNETNIGSRLFIGQMFRNAVDNNIIKDSESRVASNYFLSIYLYPIRNLYINYNGIVNKDFDQVQTSLSSGYSNNLFSLSGTFDEITDLNQQVFIVSRISELGLTGNIKINQSFRVSSNYLFDVSPSYSTKLKTTNFNFIWSDECLELIIYNSKTFYTTQNSSTWGFKVNIKSIDGYAFGI